MPNLKAIILAAGKGTRMKSRLPKVLHEVCGQPLIEYTFDVIRSFSSSGYVVLGHQAKIVEPFLPKGFKAVYQKRLLGTADAVKSAMKCFKNFSGDILILCADTPLLNKATLQRLVYTHQKKQADLTLLTAISPDPRGYGRVIRNGLGRPCGICEEKDATLEQKKITEINTGVYCVRAKKLARLLPLVQKNALKKEYYLTDLVEIFFNKGQKISTVSVQDESEGFGVNNRSDLAHVAKIIRQRILERLMSQGVTIVDPLTTFIDTHVRIGRDTVVKPCVVIEKDVVIGENCTIGPFCHLRPKTRIKKNVQIGNFAEVSRSELGENSLMKHFGFLGDARLGRSVNVGAGVVTANYDGKNKNITRVGEASFLGSDSILVAPLSLGKSVTTGAGCVITKKKKIPDGAVVVGVPGKIRMKGKNNG